MMKVMKMSFNSNLIVIKTLQNKSRYLMGRTIGEPK
jgi:hypothetical protein